MIYELLNEGANAATPGAELCARLNITRQELSRQVAKERRAGFPICAKGSGGITPPGYYKPATREEMQQFCDRLRHRAGEIFKTRRACLNTLEQLPEGGGSNGNV